MKGQSSFFRMIRRKMSRWQDKPPRSSLKTGLSGLFLVVLVLSGQGCSREPTVDEHIETARALLSEAKRQMVIVRRQTKFAAIAELKAALKKDQDNFEANAILGLTLFELGEYADAASKLQK